MTIMQEAEKILPLLTRAEKARLLKWVADDIGDTYPGVESREGVCGGEACITRTRIPVWVLERMRRHGVSESDILRSYPTLGAEDLVNAWSYVRSHREEIESQIEQNESA